MKLIKVLGAVLMTTTLSNVLLVETPSLTAHAAEKKVLKSYPKAMRKTWYRYEKNAKGKTNYVTDKITSKKWVSKSNDYDTGKWRSTTTKLHYFNASKANPKITMKNIAWTYAFNNNGMTKFNVWAAMEGKRQVNPFKKPLFGMKIVNKTYKGKKIKVFKEVIYTAAPKCVTYSYTSKALAKHFNPKGITYDTPK